METVLVLYPIDALIMYYIDGRTILQFFREWWKGKLVLEEDKLSLGGGTEWCRHTTLQVNGKKCLWNRGSHLNKQRGNTVTHSAWSQGEMREGAKLTNLPIQRTQQRSCCNHLICEFKGKKKHSFPWCFFFFFWGLKHDYTCRFPSKATFATSYLPIGTDQYLHMDRIQAWDSN